MLRALNAMAFLFLVFFAYASLAMDGEKQPECSFVWTGENWFPPDLHGSPTPLLCITCGYENGKHTCCPSCAMHCHKGHEVIPAPASDYYCDCGAKAVPTQKECCQIMPQSVYRQFEGSGFNVTRSKNTVFSLFKRLVMPEKSTTFSVVGLFELMRASGAIQGKNGFAPLTTRSLQLKAFQFGNTYNGIGIKTASSINALNELIEHETSFKNIISQGVAKALAVTAVSNEKFLLPFDERATSKNYSCFTSKGDQKTCTMMISSGEANAATIDNGEFNGARLKYEGGGSLLLLMANPKSQKTITDFSAVEIADALSMIPEDANNKLVYLPKGLWTTPSASIMKVVNELLPEASEYFAGYDDVLQAANFEITEKGTVAKSVTFATLKGGGPQVMVFDHPFIAVVADENDNPLFISYISLND